MKKSWLRQITQEEAWQITCHESGHAVLAVRYHFSFSKVVRGDGEHGELQPAGCPLDHPERSWANDIISQWQRFFAGGAAAELLLFGQYRKYASSRDLALHAKLEEMCDESRSGGWDQDIQGAMKDLDRESVEMVAKKLHPRGELSDQQVYELFGVKPPWW